MRRIRELDIVVLVRDLEQYGLKRGDVGTVVHCYEGGRAFEVEFVSGAGETIAVVTLSGEDFRPLSRAEILHVRELAPA